MKRENFYIPDFLDIVDTTSNELWVAGRPKDVYEKEGFVWVVIPFYQQVFSIKEITPDENLPPKDYKLRIGLINDSIIRLSVCFDGKINDDSPVLDKSPELKENSLSIKKEENRWTIYNEKGRLIASFNFGSHPVKKWSDLIQSHEEGFEAEFYMEGGKKIKVNTYDHFQPKIKDSLPLAFIKDENNLIKSTISFYAFPDECFAGTGEKSVKLDLAGRTMQLENQDAQGVNNMRAYKNIPFYISSQMYGVFLHTHAHAKISFADHSSRSVQLLNEDRQIDLFLIDGEDIHEIVHNYRNLTGFPSLPPLWSFGIWMSKMTYFSADEVLKVVKKLEKKGFPLDVIHLDTGWFNKDWLCEWEFNYDRFPEPEKFIRELRRRGIKISLWQLPYIAHDTKHCQTALENNYIVSPKTKTTESSSNFMVSGYAGTIDFTYQPAIDWYKNLLKNLLDMGVACIKTDFGEDIHMDAEYHKMSASELHNLFPLLYQKAAFEITKEITGDNIIWARSAWSGCQRYPVHWNGDSASSWDGLAGSIKGGLHFALSGFAFWSTDVPGFHGVPDFMNSVIPDDLYVRWTQFGVFNSHMRYHGTSAREPYEFPNIEEIIKFWWRLRYCIIPYIYEQSQLAINEGGAILSPLLSFHPRDKTCWHISDQYYFGRDFLVAPIVNHNGKRDVYLPKGTWYDFFTGDVFEGEKWIYDFYAPIERMPVWLRKGATIPLNLINIRNTDELDWNKITRVEIDNSFKGIEQLISEQ